MLGSDRAGEENAVYPLICERFMNHGSWCIAHGSWLKALGSSCPHEAVTQGPQGAGVVRRRLGEWALLARRICAVACALAGVEFVTSQHFG